MSFSVLVPLHKRKVARIHQSALRPALACFYTFCPDSFEKYLKLKSDGPETMEIKKLLALAKASGGGGSVADGAMTGDSYLAGEEDDITRVGAQDGMALAEVLDNGPGIAPTRREDVFKRFHHTGPGTDKGRHGAGLGLAIARAYARRNGGDITLAELPASPDGTASSMQGLRATLSLPLAAS